MKMDRREFIKKAGLMSLVSAFILTLISTPAPPASAAGETNFHFVSITQANTIDGVQHRINIAGTGKVSPGQVEAHGSFNHFNNMSTTVPKALLAFGTWKARRLVSFKQIGTYGALAAGVLEMEIDLIPVEGPVTAAKLTVVCNLQAAGLFTGLEEGPHLEVLGAPFGTFTPVNCSGCTDFTTLVEERD